MKLTNKYLEGVLYGRETLNLRHHLPLKWLQMMDEESLLWNHLMQCQMEGDSLQESGGWLSMNMNRIYQFSVCMGQVIYLSICKEGFI